ncbi:CRP/FNR family transcriptional regulator [Mobilisporobacter senegalensis]|uniref:CRP/FNR family transcriptional regulator n=1 Tax=Mobilisporobacter senegalensis TaxID=1329262 RepID=A0A3N1XM00_9FIRM|nr:Crp/Fnr family transcriptional regulator [Mobilisporobacter senegalensis]ROR27198.1 CRP/FNR family transcriptional regulator [Mobilisporobacter senegalensis]
MISDANKAVLYKAFNFWDKLSLSEQELIINNSTLLHYKRGDNIYSGGRDCLGVLIIKNGGLRTYILSEDGREITLYRLKEEDICILSASCILRNITFDVHIDAEVDTEIIIVNATVFQKICNHNIYAENFSNKVTVERFSDVMWSMEQILFMSFDKRLAIFLLDEISRNGNDILTLTHEQIAKYMGSAREVVSRMLKYFSNEGIVELSRGIVKVTDKKKLRKLTE